jgi:hypothetical protein
MIVEVEGRFNAAQQVQWALVRMAMKCESESKCGCESMESGEGREEGAVKQKHNFFLFCRFVPRRDSDE